MFDQIPSRALAIIAATVVLAVAPAAFAADPDWVDNHRYNCVFYLDDGTSGTVPATFANLPAQAHTFPDGNQLKRGRLQGGAGSERVTFAYKPNELPPSQPGLTRFELTLNDRNTQCKRLENRTINAGHVCVEVFTLSECDATLAHLDRQICTRTFPRRSPSDC